MVALFVQAIVSKLFTINRSKPMNIKDETLRAMAAEIRAAVAAAADDYALAMAALNAFVSNASLSDWDELETEKPIPMRTSDRKREK